MSRVDGFSWSPSVRVDKFGRDTLKDAADYLDGNGLRSELRRGMEPSHEELQLLRDAHGLVPDMVTRGEGNILVNVGRDRIAGLITGTGAAFNLAQGIVGVGATVTGALPADVALGANTGSAHYRKVDSAPTVSSTGKITAVTTFPAGVAEFAWNEWCWAIGGSTTITPGATLAAVTTPSPVMLNHKAPAALGTKGTGAAWTFTTEVTINAS